ncbi:MAG TPA: hypothetical protein VLC09_03790 [Polyangiaceae bacterium]|nr:hypothetical protein [Polyangiaceae bacterium]
MSWKRGVLGALALWFAGCSGASVDQLRARAASDLECTPERLQLQPLGDHAQRVSGCSKRLTYLEICDGPKSDPTTRCTWAQDAMSLEVEEVRTACVPNQTQACLGAGACHGAQACLSDGSAFSSCDCGSPDGATLASSAESPSEVQPAEEVDSPEPTAQISAPESSSQPN